MKFLLTAINAKYIHSNPAVYSLKAYAGEQYAPYIELAEFTINEKTETILEKIYDLQPDAIGFSCYIWNINIVKVLLKELPKILPQTDIWLGGPEVTYDAAAWLAQYPQVTGVMIGEGEASFRDLVEQYAARNAKNAEHRKVRKEDGESFSRNDFGPIDFRRIAGLCLPSGFTAVREPLDLSEIPFIYDNTEAFANRIIYYESSRGCPFSCSYCLSSVDKKVRLRDTDLVEKELQFFLDQKVKQVKFVDRTFNCHREHTRRVWTYLREHDNGVTNFHFEIAADLLNEEEIELLHSLRPGLIQLEIGVQSTNEQTIREIHRVMDVEKLAGITAEIRRGRNVHQHLDLIVGLPHEDYESFSKSFDRVYAMEPDQLQMGFLKMLKGAYMHEHGEEYGIAFTDYAPYEVLKTSWLTYGQVRRLKAVEEMVELYYNSGQFAHTLRYLISFFSGPFSFFETLADYFKHKGYDVNTPSRLYRYEVLLHFGEEYICGVQEADAVQEPDAVEMLKELLVYDMYLRENMKSRPAFAAPVTEEMKAGQRAFYRREEETRQYLPAYAEFDRVQLSRQTHLEWFRYPVWHENIRASAKDTRIDRKDFRYGLLFDYRNRDALNKEAAVTLLPEEAFHN